MLFNTFSFLVFFVCFFLVYYFVARTRTAKLLTMLVGSCLFYAAWDARYVLLLLGIAVLDYYVAQGIERRRNAPDRGKRLLVLSIVANLSLLGVYKYLDFFLDSTFAVMNVFGATWTAPALHLVLPIGISFYTFQSMSYTIDVYRGVLRAEEGPLGFLAGVAFFPHLVAGPIVRASVLLPQFQKMEQLPWEAYRRGFVLMAAGMFNKTVADLLGEVVDRMFRGGAHHDMLTTWTGMLAFAGQLYGDFCGYTDIAIGAALLLGIRLPPNFELPYFATTHVEIWRRWHMSLSTWLRDYVFTSLVRRDHEKGRTPRPYVNLFITVMLAGLWHGAMWTFVVWGIFEGLVITTYHRLLDKFPKLRLRMGTLRVRLVAVPISMYLWVLGLVLFRAPSFASARVVFADLHWPSMAPNLKYAAIATTGFVVLGLLSGHAVSYVFRESSAIAKRPAVVWASLVLMLSFSFLMGGHNKAFVYFQF